MGVEQYVRECGHQVRGRAIGDERSPGGIDEEAQMRRLAGPASGGAACASGPARDRHERVKGGREHTLAEVRQRLLPGVKGTRKRTEPREQEL